MTISQNKKNKLEAILNEFCAYADLAADWDPEEEDDYEDLVRGIKEILDE